MNNISFDNRYNIPISKGNISKINQFNQNKNSLLKIKVSSKRKSCIRNTSRHFGKEINVSSNLTTLNNQETSNCRKSLGIPINKKIKKEKDFLNPGNKTKNNEKNAILKNKKEGTNSFQKKSNCSFFKCCSNKDSKNKTKRNSYKNQNKNILQKNILSSNHTISILDDVIMKDENTNPNVIKKIFTKKLNSSFNIINKTHDDIEMKIENNFIFEKKIKTKKDIQNVDEYFDDICDELFNHEEKYLVNPQYMLNQTDINHKMRAILIDWLIDVHLKYKLLPQTMYIAVNLIDRYLEKNETNRIKLQLVGVTAMFIACKYEEIYPPELKDFVYITDGAYVKSDVLEMEYKMLKSLGFNITFPTQWSIFEIYRKKLNLNEKTFKLAWFLMELCLIDYKALKFKMSVLASSAILIASKTLGVYKTNWFRKNIGIEEKKLEECCNEIYDFYAYNSTHNLQAIRRKFSLSKFDEVAKIKLC